MTRSAELQREWRRVHGPGLPVQLQSENQAHADILQAPPAEDHEVLLCHQPQSRCQGPEAARPENRPHQEGLTGNICSPPPHMRPCFIQFRSEEETNANRAEGISLVPNANQLESKYEIYEVRFSLKKPNQLQLHYKILLFVIPVKILENFQEAASS